MRVFAVQPLRQSLVSWRPPAAVCRRKLGVLAQKVEQTRTIPEPIPIQCEPAILQRPDPHVLVAQELTRIRKRLLSMLGSAHPGLAEIAEYYFLHPSKQLRSLLVLLFSRATNGLGRHWERKSWDATCETSSALSEELDRPLFLPNVLNEWNASMPDHTESFASVFSIQSPSACLPNPPRPPNTFNSRFPSHVVSPASLLPTQMRLAQIMEMIHIASLLHGHIEQTPQTGQGTSTSQDNGFSNKLSILGGDFLLGRASTSLSRLGESEVVELVAGVISNLVEGEFLSSSGLGERESGVMLGPSSLSSAWNIYLRKIYLQTASLMAKGARSAVILGGCGEGDIWKEVAYAYGRNLGIAYQLLEDALEFNNFRQGTATGPILFASEECAQIMPLIQRNFTGEGDVELVVELVQSTSGIKRARLLASAYADKAREVLQLLPESDTKQSLEILTEMVVDRTW